MGAVASSLTGISSLSTPCVRPTTFSQNQSPLLFCLLRVAIPPLGPSYHRGRRREDSASGHPRLALDLVVEPEGERGISTGSRRWTSCGGGEEAARSGAGEEKETG